jgi:DNA-binding Lrp family transcriptional regulator
VHCGRDSRTVHRERHAQRAWRAAVTGPRRRSSSGTLSVVARDSPPDGEIAGLGVVRSTRIEAVRPAFTLTTADRQIIRVLQSDGRLPFSEVARRLGLPEKTVRRRVEQLRSDGIIEITTVADPVLLGYGASAMVGVRIERAGASDVATRLAAIDAIDYVVVSTGRFDLLAEVLSPTTEALIAAIEREIRPIPGVVACESFPYLHLYHQQPQWDAVRTGQTPSGSVIGRVALPVLDDLDRRLIVELNLDGRASFRRIAERFGVSESLIRVRANRLLASGALRIIAITNPFTLGFGVIAWLAVRATASVRLETLAEQISGSPSVTYLAVCAGRYDVLAETVCESREALLRVLDSEIRPLAGVASVEVYLCADLRYKRLSPLFAAT